MHKSIRGPPKGNRNARKGIVLPDGVKLDSVEGILEFMREVLVPSTLSGEDWNKTMFRPMHGMSDLTRL